MSFSVLIRNKKTLPILLLVVLAGWIFFLRGPTFSQSVWNTDETIHAAIARTLLDGGVLYKDAIDQRTPLSYYAFAAVFKVAGVNNLWAVRAVLSAMVTLTAFGLFLIGRRLRDPSAGLIAAFIFCALSFCLLAPADAFAAHTEWFVIFFTTLGSLLFWRAQSHPSFLNHALSGLAFACAALSKQPALLDFAAPFLTVVYVAITQRRALRPVIVACSGLLAGFLGTLALVIAIFVACGAGRDFYFYAWAYNLNYYGPEISTADRVLTLVSFAKNGLDLYPIVFVSAAAAALAFALRLVQWRPTDQEKPVRPALFYLLVWLLATLAAAASGGRDFQHYHIQILPPLALLAAWIPAAAFSHWRRLGGGLRMVSAILLAAIAWSVVGTPLVHRQPFKLHDDSSRRAAAFVQASSTEREAIFTWGFQPDFYFYSNRKPASRFVYATFLTGLIPWTNVARDKNTDYAIVPGAMETLLGDLDRHAAAFVVDFSPGLDGRHFDKYPTANFPAFDRLLHDRYVEVQPSIYPKQGLRLYLLYDAYRKNAPPLAGGQPSPRLQTPFISGPARVRPGSTEFTVYAGDPDGRLQRIEVLADRKAIAAVTFAPVDQMTVTLRLPFDRLGVGEHQLIVRTTSSHGESTESTPASVLCEDQVATAETLRTFSIPVSATSVIPTDILAPFGFSSGLEDNNRIYFAHAPSQFTYPLTPNVARLTGLFGFRPGAYAANNPTPTDGAEFIVELIRPNGIHETLFKQWVRPAQEPADRALQKLDVKIPPGAVGELQLRITPGPHGSNACDWTYWSNLTLEKTS